MQNSKHLPILGMGARVRFPLAAVAFAAACTAQLAAAQDTSLKTTVVTASRSEMLLDETLADVRVVSQEQISQASGRSLAEILQRYAGVQMSSNGGRGNTQSVYIRGSKNVILLIDGVRYGSATMGVPTLESLPLEALERIEVVQGPASALYGSDAIGGVIQIFTKQGKGVTKAAVPYASVTTGRAGYKKAEGGVSGAQNGWNYSVNAARVIEPGFSATNSKSYDHDPDADKFNQTSVNAALGYAFNADWRIDANLMRSRSYVEFDQASVYLDDDRPYELVTGSSSQLRAGTSQLKLSGKLASHWKTSFSVGRSNDDQRGYHRFVLNSGTYGDQFRTVQTEYKWGNEIATPVGVVVTGLERLEQKAQSTEQYEKTERAINAAYVGLNGNHGKHGWQANVRRDDNSQFGGFSTWGIGYGYDVLPSLRVHASRARSMKAPTLNDLYYPQSGNTALRPEQALNNELGVKWTLGAQQIKLTRFDSKVSDMISWRPVAPGSWFYRPYNVDKARLRGWSLGYQTQWSGWQLAANYEHLDAFNGSGIRMTDRLPEHQASVSLDKQWGAWKVGASSLYVGKRTDSSGSQKLGHYATLDVYGEYQFAPEWAVQARVANLTDRQYETAYGYNQRGRAGYLTLKWTPR